MILRKIAMMILIMIIIVGCEDEKETTIEPEIPNRSPVIDRLILPTQVEANSSVKLQVIARDPDKDKLSIIWEVSEGNVNDGVWTSPNRATQVEISVHISDKTNPTVSLSKSVVVIKMAEPPPVVQQPTQPQNPPPVQNPEPKALVIVPGRSIAEINIGDSVARVKALYGEPADRTNHCSAYHTGFAYCLDGNIIISLLVGAPHKAKTLGGNGIGSSMRAVKAEFGNPDEIEIEDGETNHWYLKKGILFTYNNNLTVDFIYIFRPIGAAPAAFADTRQYEQKLKDSTTLIRRQFIR